MLPDTPETPGAGSVTGLCRLSLLVPEYHHAPAQQSAQQPVSGLVAPQGSAGAGSSGPAMARRRLVVTSVTVQRQERVTNGVFPQLSCTETRMREKSNAKLGGKMLRNSGGVAR